MKLWKGALGASILLALTAACASEPPPAPEPESTDVNWPTATSVPTRAADSTADAAIPGKQLSLNVADFGIHAFRQRPQTGAGSIRLACVPTWRDVQGSPGQDYWGGFDEWMNKLAGWGFNDITFVFCGTPEWAAGKASRKETPVLGELSTRPPADMNTWRSFVQDVVSRYGDRIAAYEVWNEPTSPQFFSGSAGELAEMTQVVHDVVKSSDPSAAVVSASAQTHSDAYAPFRVKYFEALAARQWPVDAVAIHGYPAAKETPEDRVRRLQGVNDELAAAGKPEKVQVWDTEVNYDLGSNSVPSKKYEARISGDKASAWTAVSFLDSWALGIQKTYWYLWTDLPYDFTGIQTMKGTEATRTLNTLTEWVAGSDFLGCEDRDGARVCRFDGNGQEYYIAFTRKGTAELATTGGRAEVCPVDGDGCSEVKGAVKVSTLPVRITGVRLSD
ncbi:MAG: hypothetical protein KDC39_02555 [Actinobacteria bacterium]|nr:hypothetical protein [Actinomycetota bacterium]